MSKKLSIRIPDHIYDAVIEYQSANGGSVSGVIAWLLGRGLQVTESVSDKSEPVSDNYVTKDELSALIEVLKSQIQEVREEVKK